MLYKSSSVCILDVAYLSNNKSISDSSIQVQSSCTDKKDFHQSFIVISMRLAQASKEFSTNSFKILEGRSTISQAFNLLIT
jgi:hypothetical protein